MLTVALWIVPGFLALSLGTQHPAFRWFNDRLPEAMASLLGAILLFILPTDLKNGQFTLSWRDTRNIDWGTILLFGGGLALGDLMFSMGTLMSETTSNTASAAMVVPVAIAVSQAAGVPPIQPVLAACLGSSLGFMLPVSTPPNAIVYGSGLVPVRQMMRHGLVLDVIGWVGVVAVVMWIVPRVVVP
jgi:sodium-dependent dicarboxylate transporter 2/3/5